MTLVFGAPPNLQAQGMSLLTSSRQVVHAQVVEVEGLPDGTAVGDILQWDGTQWILVAGGGNVGDVLTFDGTFWTAAAPTGQTAWDNIVTSLADLPPDVAGERTLTSGSWAFKNAVDIAGSELVVPAGVNVLLKGMGFKTLTGSGASVLRVEGQAVIESMQYAGTAAIGLHVNGGNAAVESSRYINDGVGVRVDSGVLFDSRSRSTPGVAGSHAAVIAGGEVNLSQCRYSAPNGDGMQITAPAALAELTNCFVESAGAVGLRLNSTDTEFFSTDCIYQALGADADAILVEAGSTLNFKGGLWMTNPAARGSGLAIAGNIGGGLQVIGVHGQEISTGDASGEAFVVWRAGVVRRATIADCNTATSVNTAINWPAANIPTLGLSIVGNLWDDPSPYVGFDHTTARVNAKANVDQGGLMQETPIVV